MKNFDLNNITPFKAIHVGEYIKDELDARKMSQKELSLLTGIAAPILNDIIKSKRNITAEQSILIGRALCIDDDFFYEIQKQYDLDRARLSKKVMNQKLLLENRTFNQLTINN